MPVYSTQFYSGATAPAGAYTVPAGKVAVIKHIAAVNTGGTPAAMDCRLGSVVFWYGSVPAATNLQEKQMNVVAREGQTMTFNGGSALHMTISGYLLDKLPPGP
jgi:hypothetical protein